jgi:glutamate/tyrosine decarboxylase-like PLP-dependent enzyme
MNLLRIHYRDVEAKGLYRAPELCLIVSDEVQVTVLKALSLLGVGRERVMIGSAAD